MGFLSKIGGFVGDLLGSVTGGDLLGGAVSLLGGSSANSANRDIAQQQMQFQADMSGTAYQRAVKDMAAAGLNPMLAYSQGGASTPPGASYVAQDIGTPAVSSALSARRTSAEVDNMRETNKQIQSSTALNTAQTVKAKADAALSTATAAKVAADTSKSELSSDIYQAVRSLAKPLTSTAKQVGDEGVLGRLIRRLYPPDPKTGGYHFHPEKY